MGTKTNFLRLFLVLALLLGLAGCNEATGGDGATADSTKSESKDKDGETKNASNTGDEDDENSDDSASDDDAEEKTKKPKKEKVTNVNASKVQMGDLIVPVIAEGTIRSRNEAELRTEIAGRIDRVYVTEGQFVKRGQMIARLDDRQYRVELTEAENQYLEALGRLAVDEEKLDSRAATDRLTTSLEDLKDQLKRGVISRKEFQDRQLALEVDAVRDGAYRGDLVQVRSGIAAARAAKDRAALNLERSEVRAPFSGVITNLDLTKGERVNASEVICRLVDSVNLEAKVAVLESDLKGLEEGRDVRLELPALAETLQVTLDVLSPQIDPESRTCDLLMRFKNPDGRVRPGMFVRAAIAGDIYRDRLMVPREAILTRDGRPLLFKIKDKRAEWVYVQLGKSNDRMIEIEKILQGGPLKPGTLCVVSDHLTLTHNAKVKVKKVVEPEVAWAKPETE